MVSKFSAIAFDLDGTLYPNYRINLKLLPFFLRHGRLLAAFGSARKQIRMEQEADPASYRSDFYDYQAQLTAQKLQNPQLAEVREKLEHLIYRGWEPLFAGLKLFPHVRELLAELRSVPAHGETA